VVNFVQGLMNARPLHYVYFDMKCLKKESN